MHIMIVAANRERFPEPVFPLGSAFLASRLLEAGAEVSVFDAGAHRFPLRSLAGELKEKRPDVVAVSLRNVDNAAYPCTTTYLSWYRALFHGVRAATEAPVILGGPAFAIYPRQLLNLAGAEAGFAGDGEAVAGRLLERGWERGECSSHRLESLASVGLRPEALELFSRRPYRTVGIQTARGCPHRCIYCTYPLLEGRHVRRRPPAAVADEMALFRRTWGRQEFFIVDAAFNASEEHMSAVIDELRRRRLDVRFTCYMQPKVRDREIFRRLAEAGCVAVEFGTDSGSPQVLDSLGKKFTPRDVVESSAACREAGIDFCHALLFGGPGENENTVAETFQLMERTGPRAVVAMAAIRVYPGTAVAELAAREGPAAGGRTSLEPRFYHAGLDPAAGARYVFSKVAGRKNWFWPGRRNWSRSVWPRLMRLRHKVGPLWFRIGNPARR